MAITNLQELIAALSSESVSITTSQARTAQGTNSLRVNPLAQNLTNIDTIASTATVTTTPAAQTIVDTTSAAVRVIEEGTAVVLVTGPQGPQGPIGPQGTSGVSAAVIADIAVNTEGDLITVLDNGTEINAGSVNLSLNIGTITQGSVVGASITGSGLATNLNLVLPNATALGLGNVTNESKATMFANPTFTGTVSGVSAAMVGLGNVTNESKATMFTSAALTGTPTAPTATAGTNTTQIATTQYVRTEVANLINSAPGALDTLDELAAALNDDASFATTVTTAIGLKAPIDSPAFTGTVTGITKTMVGLGNVLNETKATMFTSPTFTGSVTISGGTITGITDLAVADGGTGASSITANSVILGNGTSALSGNLVAPGTSGNVLTSNGTTWTSAAATSIGVGQTWQDVTSSRAMGTTYTNSTGKPIMLIARAQRSAVSTSGIGVTINGVGVIPICFGTNSNGGNEAVGSIIIPLGATYVLSVISEALTSFTIWELR